MCRLSRTNPSAWCAPPSWKSPTPSPRATGPQGTECLPHSSLFFCPCLRNSPSPTLHTSLLFPGCPVTWPGSNTEQVSSCLADAWTCQRSQSWPSALLCTPRAEWRTTSWALRMCVVHACLFRWLCPPSVALYSGLQKPCFVIVLISNQFVLF